MNYTDIQSIKDIVLLDWDSDFDSSVNAWIEQMSRYIDTHTQRAFGVTSDNSETRVFDGNGQRDLLVDEFIEIDSVEVDGKDITANVLTYPTNRVPKFLISSDTSFRRGRQNVSVTALWGYSEEVPSDIKFVCSVLVAGIIQNQTKTDGQVSNERIGNYQVTYTDDQKEMKNRMMVILDSYQKIAV